VTVSPRLLVLTPAELSRDARARRAVAAALERGYDVVGLSGQISGEPAAPLEEIPVRRVGTKVRINPHWFGEGRGHEGRARRELRTLFRLARLLARAVRLWREGRRLGRFDVIHANDLDTLPAGFLLARRSGGRLVYDAHELYSDFEAPQPVLAPRLILLLEGALARRADAVVTVSDAVAAELRERLALRATPVVVHNAPARTDVRSVGGRNGPLRAIYQGGLGPGRGLDDLVAAARAEGVQLAIRIRMVEPDALRSTVDDRVRVLDPVTPDQAVAALANFDVGVIFDRPQSRNSDLSVPNKLFEYLMAGLAVVVPRLETLGELVERERVGLAYDPTDPDGLVEALERLAADRDALGEMRRRARELALTRLNAEAAAETLVRAWTG
jgi:glycosyltransferase involved in cell wall biosynthesis